ncbi:Ger(x)C family spore germination protein [Anaerosacchariphilus polymeriproducens]|uniref:Ger(X)C family spore germination protein n=1 Tax=Anaerosacchariphilus polymeriproducens TaxID=1812858 RepID=A0A371AV76_9FIRM|nr:Ger(x)C family spore germination C-terminal domain-containing protein [Anaerosacchariphilus polymeriproducens]RDU23449.1 hypothetical protein DWV06_09590 [Anaerosacchariphilus polymeriproducens]
MRKWFIWFIPILSVFILTGCANTELERKEFPLTLGLDVAENAGNNLQIIYNLPDLSKVTEQNKESELETTLEVEGVNFAAAQEEYLKNTDKQLDYSQLKAIVIGRRLLEKKDLLVSMLKYLESHNAISQSVMIFVSDDSKEVIDRGSKKEGSLGTYLEKLMNKPLKGEQKVTLGNLITHWRNQNETLLIPILEPAEKSEVLMDNAVILKNVTNYGQLDKEELEMLLLSTGKIINKTYYLNGKPEITLKKARVKYLIEPYSLLPEVTVKIYLKGNSQENTLQEEREAKEIKELIEKQIQERLKILEETWGKKVDLWNTFVMLGRQDRELWKKYNQKQDQYVNDRKIKFDIEWSGI